MNLPLPLRKIKVLVLPLVLLFAVCFSSQASHIRAGNIYYKSDTTAARNPLRFFFTLVTYSVAPPPFEDLEATLHFGDCTSQRVPRESRTLLPNGQVFMNVYRFEHTFAGAGTYAVTHTVGSQGGIVNISSSLKPDFFLQSTITVDPFLNPNRSPIFQHVPVDVPARNRVFTHNSGAIDADGDSLSFKLITPLAPNGTNACGNPLGIAAPGFSGLENFLGRQDPSAPAGVNLNRDTGLLTWNSPSLQGTYNIAIKVEEWRKGRLIGTMIRDMLLFAQEDPSTVTGISEEWKQQISFYPNPASGVLSVKAPAAVKVRAAQAFNSVGKQVTSLLPQKSAEGWVLDVRHLPDGFYLLNLQTDQGPLVQRVVVKH
ncbi:T9SS type A sorting domain-containing protein [Sabulibacter ruber]|uniref:T9SS type A sorting domain-containing protein n=1 Tax=Sabulibacter ruber TaxID=2811901 RepID=UPI001A967D23|nr:T9SS type A sorting domain-containing protein [Sabulibacter ruber]